jgi:hypothetical protein
VVVASGEGWPPGARHGRYVTTGTL